MNTLFFELIRVSLGMQLCLSRTPRADEWARLYEMAKKQSLVGICFAGVQRLCDSESEYYCGMNELQFLTWMGMAAKIQQRNAVVDRQCVKVQQRLSADGLRSCVLKGQGIAALYTRSGLGQTCDLVGLRQSGDIDIWVDAPARDTLRWVNRISPTNEVNFLHTQLNVFEGTEVEVHFHPSGFRNISKNRKVWKWYEAHKEEQMKNRVMLSHGGEICTPTVAFNLVFLLNHTYSHFLSEGVGLRQVMDYYFALCSSDVCAQNVSKDLKALGMLNFAGAMMWVLGEVFHLDERKMICPVDEKRGRILLEEIVKGGNFGKYSSDYHSDENDTPVYRMMMGMKRSIRFFWSYPVDVLAIPVWRIWHWCWRRKNGYK